jgi:hypothetical protein
MSASRNPPVWFRCFFVSRLGGLTSIDSNLRPVQGRFVVGGQPPEDCAGEGRGNPSAEGATAPESLRSPDRAELKDTLESGLGSPCPTEGASVDTRRGSSQVP